jgi:hypothetical protein
VVYHGVSFVRGIRRGYVMEVEYTNLLQRTFRTENEYVGPAVRFETEEGFPARVWVQIRDSDGRTSPQYALWVKELVDLMEKLGFEVKEK